MGVEYTSAGGVRKYYGPRDVESKAVAKESSFGELQEVTVEFDYDTLPAPTNDGKDAVNNYIPANSLMVAAYLYTSVDFDSTSSTTTIDVGLQKADGTAIDADGIDVEVITADGGNVGWVVNDGDLVGASVGADNAYIAVTGSADDLTAGKAKLVVQYIRAE